MIDEEWLKELRFDTLGGAKITGLAGTGGEHVVLNAEGPNGEQLVVKTYRYALAFHIKEIPPFMTETPQYEVQRVNEKLARLVGRNDLDLIMSEYHRLHSSVMRILHGDGITGQEMMKAMLAGVLLGVDDELRFFVRTPGMRRRLEEWAAMRRERVEDEDWLMHVNGPNFYFYASREHLVDWADKTLKEIDALPATNLRPDLLSQNPLYVWGGAVMDHFFTDDEIPQAVEFIERRFGRIPSHEHVFEFTMQCGAIADLMSTFLKKSEVQRFARLCAAAGVHFEVRPPRFPDHEKDAGGEDVVKVPDRSTKRSVFRRLGDLFRH
jgi:hypothetical protein